MKILGLVCSGRKLGNNEILTKYVLQKCINDSTKVSLLKLTDWNFTECKGCFGCLFKNKECNIQDDLKLFAQTVFEYDKILICSPTYLLFPPGIVKTIIDRVGIFIQQALRSESHPKIGAIIGIAGVNGWDYFTLPMLTMFLKTITGFQANIVDQVLFHHPGPGEVLLDKRTLVRCELLAERLLGTGMKDECEEKQNEFHCPVCYSNSFIINKKEEIVIKCPFCGVKGTLTENGKPLWDKNSMVSHRFTKEAGLEFVNSWILKTRKSFEKHYKTILTKKNDYKDSKIGMEWKIPK